MDPATISSSTTGFVGEGGASLGTFELRGPSNNLINATVTYDGPTRVATLDPDQPLAVSTTYTVLMKGGATDPRVKDLAGNALAASHLDLHHRRRATAAADLSVQHLDADHRARKD